MVRLDCDLVQQESAFGNPLFYNYEFQFFRVDYLERSLPILSIYVLVMSFR